MPPQPKDFQVFPDGPHLRLAGYFERMSEPRPARAQSKAEWIQKRGPIREQTLRALGLDPMPDRLPLDIRTGGVLERDGYRVERIYWQTWPRVWASGWLYLPNAIEGRAPAVLNPHGPWENGACHPIVQARLISLAKLGYLALAVDACRLCDYAVGLTPLSVMTFNNLRALDLLAARNDVDRNRIGIAGASGGAQQAMYLLAVDDRLHAGVLAAMVSYFKRIPTVEDHPCPCNPVPGVMRFTDEPALCAVASPRALMFLSTTDDWTAPFPDHELRELRAIYHLWQQPDRLAHRQFQGPHEYSRDMREATYTWFERELRGNRKAEPVPEPAHTVEDLETLRALDRPPEEDTGVDGIRSWYQKRIVAQPPQLEGKPARRNYQERVRAELIDLLGLPSEGCSLETQWQSGVPPRTTAIVDVPQAQGPLPNAYLLSFRSEADVRVPAVWAPGSGDGPWPVLIAVHPEGKAAAMGSAPVREFREAGYAVLAPDVRLRGELQRDWFHNTVLWGRPEAGMAVTDLQACIEWLLGEEQVDARGLVLWGEGDLGVVALLAAGLDERITATVADCGDTTYRDGGEGLPVIPNLLRTGDVPQIASLIAPRPLWLYRVPGERVGFSSRRYYDWTRRSFQSLGEVEALKMSTGGLPEPAAVREWLRTRLKRAKR